MATTSRTWTFTSDAEGLTDQGVSDITASWNGADGSPSAGCLDFAKAGGGTGRTEKMRGPTSAGNDWTALFSGLPSDAVVEQARFDAGPTNKVTDGSTFTTLPFSVRLVDASGVSVCAADLLPGQDLKPDAIGSWESTLGRNAVNVNAAKQAATTIVALEIEMGWTGPGGVDDFNLRCDSIQITIFYSIPGQSVRPDGDNAEGGWGSPPLWSKVDEEVAGGDVITGMAT